MNALFQRKIIQSILTIESVVLLQFAYTFWQYHFSIIVYNAMCLCQNEFSFPCKSHQKAGNYMEMKYVKHKSNYFFFWIWILTISLNNKVRVNRMSKYCRAQSRNEIRIYIELSMEFGWVGIIIIKKNYCLRYLFVTIW